ncbi:GDYXXLXY domain-containing protein [Pontibacter cellulosilyticus]|uniref:GDYXXLXY domain-containing protein n=1 Tax=Pontibacter cellulosilyticus TaxID=1720253 RepID=A0A923N4I0_9BACT|nr:GDYXXLXY domain-containing protein [Pontibacter cellulosilyticus]MBC5992745.1 GDYXXLXY domain-containing protein [Pontibacter cellulosilyticus]
MLTKSGWIILVNLVLVLALFNWSVAEKEEIIEEGELVLLELAPVDPRSLVQGDYMRLSYAISRPEDNELFRNLSQTGYAVLKLNKNNVAEMVRFQEEETPLNPQEHLLKYSKGNWGVNLGAESYFFEEGQAEAFEQAKYGGLKVDEKGNSILVGLYDEKQQLIKPKRIEK